MWKATQCHNIPNQSINKLKEPFRFRARKRTNNSIRESFENIFFIGEFIRTADDMISADCTPVFQIFHIAVRSSVSKVSFGKTNKHYSPYLFSPEGKTHLCSQANASNICFSLVTSW